MKNIVFKDLATNLYVAPFFTTFKFNERVFYPTDQRLPLKILFRKNSRLFAELQFSEKKLDLLDERKKLMLSLEADQLKGVRLGVYFVKLSLRPLPKIMERYIFSLVLNLKSGAKIHLLSDELQAIPHTIAWFEQQQVPVEDPLALTKNCDELSMINFSQFSLLSNGTEFSQAFTLE